MDWRPGACTGKRKKISIDISSTPLNTTSTDPRFLRMLEANALRSMSVRHDRGWLNKRPPGPPGMNKSWSRLQMLSKALKRNASLLLDRGGSAAQLHLLESQGFPREKVDLLNEIEVLIDTEENALHMEASAKAAEARLRSLLDFCSCNQCQASFEQRLLMHKLRPGAYDERGEPVPDSYAPGTKFAEPQDRPKFFHGDLREAMERDKRALDSFMERQREGGPSSERDLEETRENFDSFFTKYYMSLRNHIASQDNGAFPREPSDELSQDPIVEEESTSTDEESGQKGLWCGEDDSIGSRDTGKLHDTINKLLDKNKELQEMLSGRINIHHAEGNHVTKVEISCTCADHLEVSTSHGRTCTSLPEPSEQLQGQLLPSTSEESSALYNEQENENTCDDLPHGYSYLYVSPVFEAENEGVDIFEEPVQESQAEGQSFCQKYKVYSADGRTEVSVLQSSQINEEPVVQYGIFIRGTSDLSPGRCDHSLQTKDENDYRIEELPETFEEGRPSEYEVQVEQEPPENVGSFELRKRLSVDQASQVWSNQVGLLSDRDPCNGFEKQCQTEVDNEGINGRSSFDRRDSQDSRGSSFAEDGRRDSEDRRDSSFLEDRAGTSISEDRRESSFTEDGRRGSSISEDRRRESSFTEEGKRDSSFTDDGKRDSAFTDDGRRDSSVPDDRRGSSMSEDGKRDSSFPEDRGASSFSEEGKRDSSFPEDRRGSSFTEDKRDSSFSEDKRDSSFSEDRRDTRDMSFSEDDRRDMSIIARNMSVFSDRDSLTIPEDVAGNRDLVFDVLRSWRSRERGALSRDSLFENPTVESLQNEVIRLNNELTECNARLGCYEEAFGEKDLGTSQLTERLRSARSSEIDLERKLEEARVFTRDKCSEQSQCTLEIMKREIMGLTQALKEKQRTIEELEGDSYDSTLAMEHVRAQESVESLQRDLALSQETADRMRAIIAERNIQLQQAEARASSLEKSHKVLAAQVEEARLNVAEMVHILGTERSNGQDNARVRELESRVREVERAKASLERKLEKRLSKSMENAKTLEGMTQELSQLERLLCEKDAMLKPMSAKMKAMQDDLAGIEFENFQLRGRVREFDKHAENQKRQIDDLVVINEELLEFAQGKEDELHSSQRKVAELEDTLNEKSEENHSLMHEIESQASAGGGGGGGIQVNIVRGKRKAMRKSHIECEASQRDGTIRRLSRSLATAVETEDGLLQDAENLNTMLKSTQMREQELTERVAKLRAEKHELQEHVKAQERRMVLARVEVSELGSQNVSLRKAVEKKDKQIQHLRKVLDQLKARGQMLEEDIMEKEGQIAILRESFATEEPWSNQKPK